MEVSFFQRGAPLDLGHHGAELLLDHGAHRERADDGRKAEIGLELPGVAQQDAATGALQFIASAHAPEVAADRTQADRTAWRLEPLLDHLAREGAEDNA